MALCLVIGIPKNWDDLDSWEQFTWRSYSTNHILQIGLVGNSFTTCGFKATIKSMGVKVQTEEQICKSIKWDVRGRIESSSKVNNSILSKILCAN